MMTMFYRLHRWLWPREYCPVCGGRGWKQTYIKGPERFCIGHGWWSSK